MEENDARETRNDRPDGGHDAGDAGDARTSSRRQTSPGETSRDEAQGDYHQTQKGASAQDCVTRSHSTERKA